jgi:hypothetical protein
VLGAHGRASSALLDQLAAAAAAAGIDLAGCAAALGAAHLRARIARER